MINAYITNLGSGPTISVVDTSTNTVTGSITVGSLPGAVAFTPDAKKAYVANGGSNPSTVSVINTLLGTVSTTITVSASSATPSGVDVTPNGSKAYVTLKGSNAVSVIDTSTDTVSTTITVGSNPIGVAITPNGSEAYVTNNVAGTVSVIDTSTDTVSHTITVGNSPTGVAITPDGSEAYVTNEGDGTVSVINTSTHTVSHTVTVGANPIGVAITPNGSEAYVANSGASPGSVSVIDTSTHTVSHTITVGSSPEGVAITPDGASVYVANLSSSSVSVIDPSSHSVTTTIAIGTGSAPYAFGKFIQPTSIPMTNIYTAPQGRLTLTSGVPVMTADATAQTSIYYTPYQGNIVPIYDGANMQSYTFGQLTMALNTSNQTSGNLYDLFVFLNSGVVTIGAGPAWSSTTSRGTGAGTTELQQTDGLWTNKNTITLKNGSTSYSSIAANEATYLGTMYATANGQTGMACFPSAVSGGTNNFLGVWNAYNRVSTKAQCQDAAASWTYSTNTARPVNNSNSNRISFIDGLGQSAFIARYSVCGTNSLSSGESIVGIGVNSNTVMSLSWGQTQSNITQILCADISSYPLIGFNYVQAMEQVFSGTVTYDGSGVYENFILQIDM